MRDQRQSRIGEVGDGVILVCPVERFVQIRTGEGEGHPSNGGGFSAKRA